MTFFVPSNLVPYSLAKKKRSEAIRLRWPLALAQTHAASFLLKSAEVATFSVGFFRLCNRTPGPPPFSSMNLSEQIQTGVVLEIAKSRPSLEHNVSPCSKARPPSVRRAQDCLNTRERQQFIHKLDVTSVGCDVQLFHMRANLDLTPRINKRLRSLEHSRIGDQTQARNYCGMGWFR